MLPILAVSCKKEELNVIPPIGLGGETTERTQIDQWLLDSLTTPYNIFVKYRWDQWELELDKTMTPPDESKIIDAMSIVRRVWIDPYNAVTGSEMLMKKFLPKQFKLVGSVQYQVDGSAIAGRAEGGNSIIFFDINQNYFNNEEKSIMYFIETAHHEFGHILHGNVMYPQEFKGVSAKNGKAGYTSTWFNSSPAQALNNGYITPYSMNNSDDDFVEMIALMLSQGRTKFDELVSTADETAQKILKIKEQYVVNYYKTVWNIDFYDLQERVHTALYNIVGIPTVADAYGFEKDNTVASIDPSSTLAPLSAAFRNIFEDAQDSVATIPGPNVLQLDSVSMVAVDPSNSILAMFLTVNGNQTGVAQFQYSFSQSGTAIDYTYVGEDANGAFIKDAVQPLLDYFSNNTFNMTWHADPSVSVFPRIRFSPQGSPNSYFTASLYP